MSEKLHHSSCALEFNRFYVIESLNVGEDKFTGTELCELLKPLTDTLEVTSGVYTICDNDSWMSATEDIKSQILDGVCPILHLEIHGDSEGLCLNSGDIISWSAVYERLSELNQLTHCNMMVTFAVCCGLNIFRQIKFDRCMPFCFTIGSMKKMYENHIEVCFQAFYQEFFLTLDIDKAVAALNRENMWEDEYVAIKADILFAYLHYLQCMMMNDSEKALAFAELSIDKLPEDVKNRFSKEELVKMFLETEAHHRDEDYLKRVDKFFCMEDDPENWNRFWICNTTEEIMNAFKDTPCPMDDGV